MHLCRVAERAGTAGRHDIPPSPELSECGCESRVEDPADDAVETTSQLLLYSSSSNCKPYGGRRTVGREHQQQLISYVWWEFNHMNLCRVKQIGGGRAAAPAESHTAGVQPWAAVGIGWGAFKPCGTYSPYAGGSRYGYSQSKEHSAHSA